MALSVVCPVQDAAARWSPDPPENPPETATEARFCCFDAAARSS